MGVHLPKLGWLLSPSRKLVDWLKRGKQEQRGNILRCWSLGLFVLELIAGFTLMLLLVHAPSGGFSVPGAIAVIYAFSRINEIAYAFYRDPLSKAKESDLKADERIRMAMRSYYGLLFNFALLYYFLPVAGLFKEPLNNFFEAIYFSGITLATLGYGDIVPIHWFSRLLALYEVFTGILLVAVAVATYIGAPNESNA